MCFFSNFVFFPASYHKKLDIFKLQLMKKMKMKKEKCLVTGSLFAGKDDHVYTRLMWYHVMCLEDSRLWTVWSFILKSSPDLFQCILCRLVVHRWPLKGAAAHQIIAPVYFRLCILTVHQPTHQANIQILLHYDEHDSKNSLSASVSLFYWRTSKT